MRKSIFLGLFAGACLTAIGWLFWQQEMRYLLPTPRPAGLVQPGLGQPLVLPVALSPSPLAASRTRPTFLHFFNPDCPCSRFNWPHVRSLVAAHADSADFIVVLQTDDPALALEWQRENPLPGARVLADTSGTLAQAAGVYSTPQAVLLDGQGRLFYRGNYNTSRYCSRKSTEFARLALERLLAASGPAPLQAEATRAYGCQLPGQAQPAFAKEFLF